MLKRKEIDIYSYGSELLKAEEPLLQAPPAMEEGDQEDKGKEEDVNELFSFANGAPQNSSEGDQKRSKKGRKSETPMLDKFGTSLTDQARAGALDPVFGREKEMLRVAQILARKKKNNPILLGDPGVGKTAIVEAIAQRIVTHQVPVFLLNKEIVSVDLASIVAGSMYRGQFEERMKGMIEELKANPNIILYIDEIHTLMGSGNSQGGLDAANILKPALSRGEIRCIGATTLEEYRKTIEKDGAMDRRFQKVIVEAPDKEETLEILKRLRPRYEQHHKVAYTDQALEAAVRLTEQYVTDRHFPDKAIDALDESGAYTFMLRQKPVDFTEYEKKIKEATKMKHLAVHQGNYEMASKYRDEEKAHMKELEELKAALERGDLMDEPIVVDVEEVERVVSLTSGIPMESLTKDDLTMLSGLEERLLKRVKGQDHVVKAIATAIQRNKIGLRDPSRPIGTFLFLGSSGVGKTHLSKQLARELFGSEDAMIRVDMSEYMERHTVSRLIGAPPGYVGFEEGGELTKKVKQRPYSVVLFDEIEKAHGDVHNLLLQLLDDGVLTDSNGMKVNFKNTIVIMTSNVGTRQLNEFGTGIGFRSDDVDLTKLSENVIQKSLKKTFAPEFLNRIDKIVTFNQLSSDVLRDIVELELADLDKRLKELKLHITFTDAAKDFLAEKGYDPRYGVRPLKRAIAEYVEEVITQSILDHQAVHGGHYIIDVVEGKSPNALRLLTEEPVLTI